MMAVLAGTLRSSIPSPQGKQIVRAHLAAGKTFGTFRRSTGAVGRPTRRPRQLRPHRLERRDLLPTLKLSSDKLTTGRREAI